MSALVVEDYGCCALEDGHDGPCAGICDFCQGDAFCPACDGTGLELSCQECGGSGTCPYCDEGLVTDQ